jgi:hypothetical protein
MKLSQALSIILIQTPLWYAPVVRCEKGQMGSSAAAAAEDNNDNDMGRVLASSANYDDRYPYSRNYVTVIEPDNFIALTGSGSFGEGSSGGEGFDAQGTSIIEFGNVYDPADLAIVNKLNGVEIGDPFLPKGNLTNSDETIATGIIGQRYAGDRQPKLPIPSGDKSYFFHGGTYTIL